MTRINLIPVSELTDNHLLAEHREIKRIPNVISSGRFSLVGAPSSYTMGKGHVKFFYDKLMFLLIRYRSLYDECIKRGFNVENYVHSFDCPLFDSMGLFNNYIPTKEAINISRKRIDEKIAVKPLFYRREGKNI